MARIPIKGINIPAKAPIFPIRTAAKLTGVPVRTIRSWDYEYHLVVPTRTTGRHRLYSIKDLQWIALIKRMLDRGMSLKGIERLLDRSSKQKTKP